MRPALSAAPLLAVLTVLGSSLPAAEAEWLVLVGGKKIQTEGPWSLKGDLLTVHETTGRILTVGTNTVDAAACLKLNGGSLRIEAIAVAPPPGAPVSKPEVAPPPPAGATTTVKPAKGHGPNAQAPASAPAAGTAAPGSGAAATAAAPAGIDAAAAARKQARQAQLQRELRYKQIVDGCAHMFVVDRAGFQRCVDAQTKASPPPPSPPVPPTPPAQH
jgi:hypothetical protein